MYFRSTTVQMLLALGASYLDSTGQIFVDQRPHDDEPIAIPLPVHREVDEASHHGLR